jgi:hypothetical protein
LIGTAVRGGGNSTTVAYRTDLPGDAAHSALLAALGTAGWAVEDDALSRISPEVFQLMGGSMPNMLCRDGERLTLRVMDIDETRYPTIVFSAQGQPRACNAEDPQISMIRSRMPVRGDTPTLQFPASTRSASADGRLNGGMGGSGETMQTAVQIRSPDSAQALVAHLGEQMREQGWNVDASWAGRLSNGARWTREDEGTPVWGTIEIVALGDGTFDVSYRQMTPPF